MFTSCCLPPSQLTNWLEELHTELQSTELADSVEGAEQLLVVFNQHRDTTVEAAINTVGEGEQLLEQLRLVSTETDKSGNSADYKHIQGEWTFFVVCLIQISGIYRVSSSFVLFLIQILAGAQWRAGV